ncbi:MAG: TonB family protein [Paludibacter sp.]
MGKIDLTSFEWRELVFQGKNKEYGAYALRSDSNKRHNRAMLIITIVAIILFSIPAIIGFIKKNQEQKVEYGPTVMTKLPPAKVNDEHIKKVESVEPPPALKTSVKFTAPVIKKDEEVNENDEMKSQEELTNTKGIISIANVKGNDDVNGKDIADVKADVTQIAEEEKVYDVIEQMPQFPGGEGELLAFIGKNLKYPVIAQENGIQGTVIVRFVVSRTGAVDKVEVLRSLDPACDREAIRVVRTLPNWIPGKQNGVNVSVYYTLPIKYKLE